MKTIRGAITADFNTEDDIRKSTVELLECIIEENSLNHDDIESIIFSVTNDLTKSYPAKHAREIGLENPTYMCMQEMHVEGSLRKCIRILMFARMDDRKPNHIYLKNASRLRTDLDRKG
ncbi:chorismate mutase [Dethiosulfatibacter aminovorans DSM 17477]|uniref:chorismate mutase n=1 Tax=Dethiosulfatibacter aminovorans DSM 17477 TaxID=1121476 RepID=A0A1M6DAZ4_9FIRM|nr:chorismate mutase [Dethiosulfatibacter aminovorans]SHI70393.1 chorismate mutase [Dethiosulfatibacter aminovorans DSM 17477]